MKKKVQNIILILGLGIINTNVCYSQKTNILTIDFGSCTEIVSAGVLTGSRGVNDLPDDPQHPMFGMNLYVSAWDEDYQTNLDWYGSGDRNGDNIVNMADYNYTSTGTDPFNDGTHRGDTDLDGDSGDADDKAIILDYINGNIDHINMWEKESESEKTSHLVKALAIDPTSEINAGSSGWLCGQYMTQLYVNFTGVYDINNSGLSGNNGTNLQYDLGHNGIFRIPLRNVDTFYDDGTTTGPHNINVVYLGDPNNQDATNFEKKLYPEPQTDVLQEPGDDSFNDYANEEWYGYYFNELFQQWKYGTVALLDYDLDATPIAANNIHEDYVISWTPFSDVEYPQDQVHEFPGDTSVSVNGEPTNLYVGTSYSHSDVSNQTNDGTCTDVTYNVTRTFEGQGGGAYNVGNTPEASHDQNIDVEDTTPPTWNGNGNWSDNSGLEVIVTTDTTSTQGTNPTQCNYYTYEMSVDETGTDVCGNEGYHAGETQYFSDTEGTTLATIPFQQGDTLYRADMSDSPDPTDEEWAEFADDQMPSELISKEFSKEIVYEDGVNRLYGLTQWGEDACQNDPLETFQYFVNIPKTVGTPENELEKKTKDNAYVFPNPSNGNLTLHYKQPGTIKVGAYDLSGRQIGEEQVYENLPQDANIPYHNLNSVANGLYILKIQDDKGNVETLLIEIQNARMN